MTEREKILGRIREAVRLKAPIPGHHGAHGPAWQAVPRAAADGARDWLPPVADQFDDWLALFAKNSESLRTSFHRAADVTAAIGIARDLAQAEGWKRIAWHGTGAASEVARALSLPGLSTDGGYAKEELESCDAGFTQCDLLVAQTGSVVVTPRTCGGRALSVLPPHHIVLATRDQLVPDMPAAFEWLRQTYGAAMPSMVSFITGPSRTGDIERILVLGAHGPKKVTVILVG